MSDQKAVTIHQEPSGNLPKTAGEILQHKDLIQKVIGEVMKEEVHYGHIPGTPQGSKTLYKAGAEILLSTFRIAVEPEVEDLSADGEIAYRVHCRGVHMGTGMPVGTGIGEASTRETKYRWRAAVCKEEFDEAEPDRRRVKWKKGDNGGPPQRLLQVRMDEGDVANTVLKMAKKRGVTDLCLTALAASDIFIKPKEPGGNNRPRYQDKRRRTPPPQASQDPDKDVSDFKIGEQQFRIIRARLQGTDMSEQDLLDAFSKKELGEFTFDDFNNVLQYISERAAAGEHTATEE